jgi:hypothetical protein
MDFVSIMNIDHYYLNIMIYIMEKESKFIRVTTNDPLLINHIKNDNSS